MRKKYIKIFRNCVLAVICIVLVIFMIIPDYIMCFFSRDFYFRKYPSHKKVLILMGSAHVTLEEPKLEQAGYKKVLFPETEKN
ncbi:hypothetical protein [Clostridium sp. 001]|uniref:hypothetical protein n=1 Tax=Clostridium sp. 001 TaxID=1970093 RepID=UPI0020B67CD4|nr:hypothetical protein [Clostridium sp. 001]